MCIDIRYWPWVSKRSSGKLLFGMGEIFLFSVSQHSFKTSGSLIFSPTYMLSFFFFVFFLNNSTTVIIFIIFNHLTKCAEWSSHLTSCLKLIWPSEVMTLTNFYWQVSWLYYSGESLFLFLKERVNKRKWALLQIKGKERVRRLYPPFSRLEQPFSLSHPVLLLFSVSL